jgi:hypothetical protein
MGASVPETGSHPTGQAELHRLDASRFDPARKFTQGPWRTGVWEGSVSGRSQFYGRHAAVFAPSGDMVCPCGLPDDPENIPNARLIAAAPELYEALERVCDTYGFDASTDSSIWQEAFAALAKARGEA